MQLQHQRAAQLTAAALVRFARVGKTVAQHPLAFFQSGKNLFFHVLRAIGEHERELSRSGKAGGPGAEQHGPQILPERGPAGLARGNHVQSAAAQVTGKVLQLSGFAHAVESLKSNEFSAMSLRHDTDLNTKRHPCDAHDASVYSAIGSGAAISGTLQKSKSPFSRLAYEYHRDQRPRRPCKIRAGFFSPDRCMWQEMCSDLRFETGSAATNEESSDKEILHRSQSAPQCRHLQLRFPPEQRSRPGSPV